MGLEETVLKTMRGMAVGALLTLPATGFAQTLVMVRDEAGARVGGAEIYRNCELQGVTSGAGMLVISAAAGDHLQVRKLVETGATGKGAHGGWSYHAWRTNITMRNDGRQLDFTVTDPAATQEVVLRRQNTQIGWNLVASVEYNASPANLSDIALGLQRASEYLFDVTDGQFFIERSTLYEERQNWSDADIQLFATAWPSANPGGPGGLASPAYHMYLPGPGFDGWSATPGTWQLPYGFRTIIHEHGHYGLGLWDEYYRTGGSATCTLDRYTVDEDHRGSIMAYQYDATELCHDRSHNPATSHGEVTGRSTWGSVTENWPGAGTWTLRTPMMRGVVNPGPNALSCFARMTPTIVPVPEPSCESLRVRAVQSSGDPLVDVPVDLHHGGRLIAQGNTDAAGERPIYGAVPGDRVTLRPYASGGRICFWQGASSATVADTCGPLDMTADWWCLDRVFDHPLYWVRFIHEGDPAPDVHIRIPVVDPSVVIRAVLEQDGLGRHEVPLTYDAKAKALVGSVAVDPKRALEFALELTVPGPDGKPVVTAARLRGARFDAQAPLGPGATRDLMAADADVNLGVDASTLPDGTGVLVSEAAIPEEPPAGLAAAAAVVTVAGERPLQKAAALSLRYDAKGVQPQTVQVYRLEGGKWIALQTTVDVEARRATADVDAWGTYAVFGQRAF